MARDLIVERTREALRHKVETGEWDGRVPWGYRLGASRLIAEQALMREV